MTIQELIANKDNITAGRKRKYKLETASIGTIVCVLPDAALVAEALDITPSFKANVHILYNTIKEPNIHDTELQQAYRCFAPEDIVEALFLPGEITRIASTLLDLAGFRGGKIVAKLYEEIKN